MTDEHLDPTFRELQAALTLTPSPEFAAKVRARVAEAPARSWTWGWSVAAVSVAAVGCAVVAVVMWRGAAAPSTEAPQPAVARVETPSATGVEPPATVGMTPARVVRGARRAASVVAAPVALCREPDVIVPPGERIALMRLLSALQEGRAVVPAAENVFDEETGALKPLAAIVPLVVEPLSTAAPGGGSGRRER